MRVDCNSASLSRTVKDSGSRLEAVSKVRSGEDQRHTSVLDAIGMLTSMTPKLFFTAQSIYGITPSA